MLLLVFASSFGACLVVVPPAHDLLAGGPEKDGVLILGGVAALDVAKRRVGVYDAEVTQIL